MRLHRSILLVALVALVLAPARAHAQNAGLAGLLLRFFAADNPVILVITTHVAHFGSQPNAQATMTELNRAIAAQLTTFPLGSSSGGFAYTFDPALGVFSRATESFGPLFAERALTVGKGKLSFGSTYLRTTFDAFEGQNLRNGDLVFHLIHRDINRDGSHFEPYFEGDRIEANLFLDISADTTVFFANYGVTDRLDVGFALPYLRLDMDARIHLRIEHLSTAPDPPFFIVHTFRFRPDGSGEDDSDQVQRGSSEGLGDLVVRGKYMLRRSDSGGLALGLDLRLPTGDEQELLGSGATQAKLYAIASSGSRKFSPHVNLGYTFSRGGAVTTGNLPDEINYTVGFDAALGKRLTLTGDVVGRTLLKANRIQVGEEEWDYALRDGFKPPPVVLPRLVVNKGDLNVLIGAMGLKFNPFGTLLVSGNVLLSQGKRGLQDYVTPVVSVDYSF